ncbi:hypothetical protein [Streptomyces sp. NPDC006335]|uniref:LexA family protein n=1 Tax=Streptomyces sp. NPDC006335 TaxID=3156895 RepID=UPI0033A58CBF
MEQNHASSPLTIRQSQVLTFLTQASTRLGYAPSLREICEGTGLRSTSTAAHHIRTLAERGLITHDPKIPRSIRVVGNLSVPSPAGTPQSAACSLLDASDDGEGAGTTFVLQALLGPGVGRALIKGAVLTVQYDPSCLADSRDDAILIGRVTGITHPL